MENYYRLHYDMDADDAEEARGNPFIFANESNEESIGFEGLGVYSFEQVIRKPGMDIEWPEVVFTYDSGESDRECDYLNNVISWPLVHSRVVQAFTEAGIAGIRYYPVKLVDRKTGKANVNYSVMYVESFIDAYDMEKSSYRYFEEYNMYSFSPGGKYLDRRNCRGYDIFRPDNQRVELIVSEKIRKIVTDNGFTGFGLDLMK